MERGRLLYEGKAKRLYGTAEPDVLLVEYKDSATALNGRKKEDIPGKGVLNNRITALLFGKLAEQGIRTHFIRTVSDREQLVRHATIIPLETVVRNVVAGSLAGRTGLPEGTFLEKPLVEFYYKDDELGDPLVTDDHIRLLGAASDQDLKEIRSHVLRINTILQTIFKEAGVTLVDFKTEFGRDPDGDIFLADEISPDTCRLWDSETGEHLDKDLFRQDLGGLTEAYRTIYHRLGGQPI